MSREFALRSAAQRAIQAGERLTLEAARIALRGSAAPPWVLELEARLAAVRVDALAEPEQLDQAAGSQVLGSPSLGSQPETPGAAAARLALLVAPHGEDLKAVLARGLQSPFSAVRSAARLRLARESALDPARGIELLSAAYRTLDEGSDQRRGVEDLAATLGLGALLELGVPASSVLARFEDLIVLPISEGATKRLRESPGAPELAGDMGELFGLIRSLRRGEAPSLSEQAVERLCLTVEGQPLASALASASEEARRILSGAEAEGRRAAGAAVGERLIERALELDSEGELLSPALLAGLRMIPASAAFHTAMELPGAAGLEALAIADESSRAAPPKAMEELLRLPEGLLFDDAFWIVGRRFAHGGEAALEPALRALLDHPNEEVRQRAFGWLARAGRESDQSLRQAFRDAGPGARAGAAADKSGMTERQRLYLRELDRSRPHPEFKDVVLKELSGPGPMDVSAVDLARALRRDPEVRLALLQRLDVEVQAVLGAADEDARLRREGAASQLVRALGGVEPDAVEDALRQTLGLWAEEAAHEGRRPKLPKAALGSLAASDPRRVESFLGPTMPRRVRVEAALQIFERAQGGALLQAAAAALMDEFDAMDGSQRLSSVRALSKLPRDLTVDGLSEFAAQTIELRGSAEGLAAVDLAAARGMAATLAGAVRRAVGPGGAPADGARFETALAAARRLAGVQGAEPSGLARTFSIIEELDRRLFADPSEESDPLPDQQRSALMHLRGELLEALVRAAVDPRLAEDPLGIAPRTEGQGADRPVLFLVLRAPIEAAVADLERRFAGDRLLKASFRWRAELECVQILGERGLAGDLLSSSPGWGRTDGRLLAALGAAAGRGSAAVELLAMGIFAMEGERDSTDRALRLAAARLRYVALLREDRGENRAGRLGRLLEIARVEVDIAANVRAGLLPTGVLGASYGRSEGIPSLGIRAGDPGERPRVTALAGIRAAAAQYQHLMAAAELDGADSAAGEARSVAEARSAAETLSAAEAWAQWRRLLAAGF